MSMSVLFEHMTLAKPIAYGKENDMIIYIFSHMDFTKHIILWAKEDVHSWHQT